MNKINLRWVGPFSDSSGYAVAARGYIEGLLTSEEIELTLSSPSFEIEKTTHGKMDDEISRLINRPLYYQIQIIHLTPENFPLYSNKDIYTIGLTTWETDRLPPQWVELCNSMNEIWVPSTWNKKVFLSSGVTCPITVIPHGVSLPDITNACYLNFEVGDSTYLFYSIFQWLERKAPQRLLLAYLSEFKPEEDVCLALKTYRLNTSSQEQAIIKQEISFLKESMRLKKYPALRFLGGLLSDEFMMGLHERGDCMVFPTRAEGFSLTAAAAMSHGNPVITTNYSGHLDFMNKTNSYLIDYQETPVCNMLFPLYTGDMIWAEPDVVHLRKLMRFCFENQEKAIKVGKRAQKDIAENLNWKKVTSMIVNRLKEIQLTIGTNEL